jgi:microsomal dipeptidase-like Zn-dependent dipeptidase
MDAMDYGYADLHCHPMAHLAFGGRVRGRSLFWGKPLPAVESALPSCHCAHSVFGLPWSFWSVLPLGLEREFIRGGYDSFETWPRPVTTIHQQMHVSQVKRAWCSGLRLLVSCAMNNELLADKYHCVRPRSLDDITVRAQLRATDVMARQNPGWIRIVKTPEEARRAISENKLAIVLAVEIDSIVGASMRRESQWNAVDVDAAIDKWWTRGVRMITPIHLADNALGGCAVYNKFFNFLNHYLISKHAPKLPKPWFLEVVDAATVPGAEGVNFVLKDTPLLSSIYGSDDVPSYGDVSGTGHANRRGLSEAGKDFIKAMMVRGMIIDVEHMSTRSLRDTLEIATELDYPIISSHTSIRKLAVKGVGQKSGTSIVAHEAMRSDEDLKTIREIGGVLGIGAHVGPTIHREIDDSSNWMVSYRYALESLGFKSVGIGTDMNGLAQTPGPRFDRNRDWDPAPRWPPDCVRQIAYDKDRVPLANRILDRAQLGRRRYDFNLDGLAHYGLLPDFTLDVALSLGEGDTPDCESMKPFFSSARAFVDAWSKCVARSQSPQVRSAGR